MPTSWSFRPEIDDEAIIVFVRTNLSSLPQNASRSSAEIRALYPSGVDQIVAMASAKPGWSVIPNSRGIIAILIGLRSAAITNASANSASPERREMRSALKPGGGLGG